MDGTVREIDARDVGLERLGLSVRTLKALHRLGVRTAEDALATPRADLLAGYNVGPKTLDELDRALAAWGCPPAGKLAELEPGEHLRVTASPRAWTADLERRVEDVEQLVGEGLLLEGRLVPLLEAQNRLLGRIADALEDIARSRAPAP